MSTATNITQHYFEFNTIKYFRGKAENVEIGSYGDKDDPVGPQSYLAVQAKVKREHLKGRVKRITTAKIDWNKQSKADVEVSGVVKYFGLNGQAAVSGSYEKAKSARLELVKFAINEGPLKTMLNKEANGARKYLAEEGRDGRIVSEIWVWMDGELAEHFATSGAIETSVGITGADLELTAKGGTHGSQTIRISAGTTFAYLLHKVKKWNKDKTQIEDLEDDSHGLR
jgi:hypothetical protein